MRNKINNAVLVLLLFVTGFLVAFSNAFCLLSSAYTGYWFYRYFLSNKPAGEVDVDEIPDENA